MTGTQATHPSITRLGVLNFSDLMGTGYTTWLCADSNSNLECALSATINYVPLDVLVGSLDKHSWEICQIEILCHADPALFIS